MGETTRAQPIVIAHRGASGYLPEHTLAAKALAVGMGADFLEQDVVLTRDNQPIVLHDIHLDTVTDVAQKFPGKHRSDGRFYALDLTLAEIRQLRVTERVDFASQRAVFEQRFPVGKSAFAIPTFGEEIELVQGLAKSTGRAIGIYPELKAPAWHHSEGRDISRVVLETLAKYGYVERSAGIYLQCFDAGELRRIRFELGCDLKLVQLIGENDWAGVESDHSDLRTQRGLVEVAKYADGIGPRIEHLFAPESPSGELQGTPLVRLAHEQHLAVHPYTFRSDALPAGVSSVEQLLQFLFRDASVDGVFTDFPDTVSKYVRDR